MKAVLYDSHGGPEVLRYVDVADPEPGPGDVVVQVAATALNRLDIVQRAGYFTMPGFAFPHIAGMDVAGVVAAVGEAVDDVSVGDRVVVDPSMSGVREDSLLAGRGDLYGELGIIGATADGGYAELCLVPASHVFPLPDGMSFDEAVVFPTCWMTAAHALFDVGRLQAGETVLIHAAGSGVSTAGIQLAVVAGARVLATAGTDEKCARAEELGAAATANNRTTDIAGWARAQTDGAGVDMVFEHVGPALWEASMFSLGVRGRLVNCGNTTGDSVTIPSLGHLFHMGLHIIGSDPYRPEEFGPVWEQYCGGDFVAPVDSVMPLSEAAAAQERMFASDLFGKIVLRP
ncbi:MAG: zinc-binding dehydrogenase [Acidimicrobiia bacterium]|nr:zinc-binding dehydrogenase [Acidimicrobiia bacterium]